MGFVLDKRGNALWAGFFSGDLALEGRSLRAVDLVKDALVGRRGRRLHDDLTVQKLYSPARSNTFS
jgi:hypothetical protein